MPDHSFPIFNSLIISFSKMVSAKTFIALAINCIALGLASASYVSPVFLWNHVEGPMAPSTICAYYTTNAPDCYQSCVNFYASKQHCDQLLVDNSISHITHCPAWLFVWQAEHDKRLCRNAHGWGAHDVLNDGVVIL